MDQELANKLFDVGAFLLFLDAPPNLEFGVDYIAWTVGPLFKGIKLIPPGLHFVYFSSTNKEGTSGIRTGFFHFFESQEIVVREWNPQIEDLRDETELDPKQVERLRINIRDFDRNMGPYPLDQPMYYQRWKKLTSYITPGLVRRVLPNNGKVSHLPEKSPDLSALLNETSVNDKRLGKSLEREEGMEFTRFDVRRSFPPGATGDEITKWSLDKSWLVKDLLSTVYHNDYRVMLGELQLAFVCLLMAQNFSGFHQWKQLVHLLCSCSEFMEEKPQLFLEFIDVLETQLEECPDDFYRDILSENNFTSIMLKTLKGNIPGSNEELVKKYGRLQRFLIEKFGWEVPEEDEADEDDEDAPVIVEME
ncbi:A1 cistron-splicing factor [Choanephora cucurbitarum]|nr:A1 cistron-splicing factor [Choanephora cucurbitarum]